MLVAVVVALAPGLSGQLARAESQAPRPQVEVIPAGGLSFSDPPRDAEFLSIGLFALPLVPVGTKATTPDENRELAAALHSYVAGARGRGPDEVGPLVAFLQKHAQSPWRPSLEVGVGAVYRSSGHFSKALPIWQAAWEETKGLEDLNGRSVGDAAAGYLSQMEAYLGRKETLAPLLEEIKKRPVRGRARELVENSAEGLASMLHSPQDSFRCGPAALARILQLRPSPETAKGLEALGRALSTPNGLSLSTVQKQSVDAGMNYQMAFRSPGAPVIVPAVAHWKVGHFAAILREKPDAHYVVGDLTFGHDVVVSRATLDEEASGFFLVPPGPLPDGWRPVEASEGDSVWGRGSTGNNHDLAATGWDEIHAFPQCSGKGCTIWNVEASVVGLSLHDDPVGYTPPYGPPIRFALDYSHRDALQPPTFNYTNFGNKWTFQWLSYIAVGCEGEYGQNSLAPLSIALGGPSNAAPINNASTPPAVCVTWYRPGGGSENYFFQYPLDTSQPGNVQYSYAGEFSQAYLTANLAANEPAQPTSFTRTLPDGTVQYFTKQLGTYGAGNFPQYFMTAIQDPQGNQVSIGYDTSAGYTNQARITTITDALNKTSTVCYADSLAPCAAPGTYAPAPVCTPSSNCTQVTQIIDPFQRYAAFGYGQDNHLTSIKDSIGITSSFDYQLDFIDQLTTPYGVTQFAFYGALDTLPPGQSPSGSNGDRAVRTIDPLGRTSMVEFIQGDTRDDMTACQTTNVASGDSWTGSAEPGTHIPCTEKYVPSSSFQPDFLQYRNTFIWDAYQFGAACPAINLSSNTAGGLAPNGLCYPNAKIIHWLHTNENGGFGTQSPKTASRTPESIKGPAESRIWFQYPNQSSPGSVWGANLGYASIGVGSSDEPIIVARVITNPMTNTQTPELWNYTYNANGNLTQIIDPKTRKLELNYAANGVDLVNVINMTNGLNDMLLTQVPGAQHLPSSVTPANGQPTSFTYNNGGQVLTKTDPLNNKWTYCYQAGNCTSTTPGYLQSITGPTVLPGGAPVYSFTYDGVGRIGSTTDPSGEKIQYWYDNADRLTQAQFPDTTTVQLGYTNQLGQPILDLTSVTDRAGSTTARTYDSDRELGAAAPNCSGASPPPCCATATCTLGPAGANPGITENFSGPIGSPRTTVLSYWGNKTPQSIQDPNGHLTTVNRDLEGHVTQIVYADTNTKNFEYDDGGKVVQQWPDSSGQNLTYTYNKDDTLASVQFDNNTINYSYDTAYMRLQGWSRFVNGITNEVANETYTYFPVGALGANRLHVDTTAITPLNAPGLNLTSTTTYQTGTGAPGYDALDRMIGRVTTSSPASTSISDQWTFDALGRLVTDTNWMDTFSYAYSDATSRVSTITSKYGPTVSAAYYTPQQHDGLLSSLTYTARQFINKTWYTYQVAQYAYVMDSRHNITSFTDNEGYGTNTQYGNTYTYDAYSQLLTADQTVTAGSQSTWNNSTYGYDPAGNLTSWGTEYSTIQGSPAVTTVYNSANRITSQTITHADETGSTTLYGGYDSAGNLNSLAPSSGFEQLDCNYDGMNNPVDCFTSSGQSRFVYDGIGRLIRDTQLSTTGAITRDESYVWCGESMCAAFDNTSGTPTRTKVYVNQGQQNQGQASTDNYYIRDLQGSVRATTPYLAATAVVRYQYDAYGNQTLLSGNGSASDFGFAGMFRDSKTGLSFARNRVYYPSIQRWLSRDPIGNSWAFRVGVADGSFNASNMNLYGYVRNNPASRTDRSGFAPDDPTYWEQWQSSAETARAQDPEGTLGIVLAFEAVGVLGLAEPISALALDALGGLGWAAPAASGATGAGATLVCDDLQVGHKFGEHMSDVPGYRSPEEYVELANQIFNDPNAIQSSASNGDILYQVGSNILRVTTGGSFVSLYPSTQ